MSAFCSKGKGDKSRTFHLSKIPTSNLLTQVTCGLKCLYKASDNLTRESLEFGSCTNEDGHFAPRSGLVIFKRYICQDVIERKGQSAVLINAQDSFQAMALVAIKVIHTSYLSAGLKEADTLRRLNGADSCHVSHTVRLLNTFMYDDHVCLVFPLFNPVPLNQVITDWKLDTNKKLRAIRKVAFHLLSALAFLKRNNTIHADIKPENVLVKSANEMKGENILDSIVLVDFGNAIHHTHTEVSLYYSDFDLQTLPYRAPEVSLGIPFGVEIDMWSLGCLLAEIYIGKILFRGTSRSSVLREITKLLGPLPEVMCRRGKFGTEKDIIELSQMSGKSSSALDLMSKIPPLNDYSFASFLCGLLCYCPDQRLTPWQALQHPFMSKEICIGHFIEESSSPQCLIAKTDYSHSQIISSDAKRMSPSTYDLLKTGTQQLVHSWHIRKNVARVQPIERSVSTTQDGISSSADDKQFDSYCFSNNSGSTERRKSVNADFTLSDSKKKIVCVNQCKQELRNRTQSWNYFTEMDELNAKKGINVYSRTNREKVEFSADEHKEMKKLLVFSNDTLAKNATSSHVDTKRVHTKESISWNNDKIKREPVKHDNEKADQNSHVEDFQKLENCLKSSIVDNAMHCDSIVNLQNSKRKDSLKKSETKTNRKNCCKVRPRSLDTLQKSCLIKDSRLNETFSINDVRNDCCLNETFSINNVRNDCCLNRVNGCNRETVRRGSGDDCLGCETSERKPIRKAKGFSDMCEQRSSEKHAKEVSNDFQKIETTINREIDFKVRQRSLELVQQSHFMENPGLNHTFTIGGLKSHHDESCLIKSERLSNVAGDGLVSSENVEKDTKATSLCASKGRRFRYTKDRVKRKKVDSQTQMNHAHSQVRSPQKKRLRVQSTITNLRLNDREGYSNEYEQKKRSQEYKDGGTVHNGKSKHMSRSVIRVRSKKLSASNRHKSRGVRRALHFDSVSVVFDRDKFGRQHKIHDVHDHNDVFDNKNLAQSNEPGTIKPDDQQKQRTQKPLKNRLLRESLLKNESSNCMSDPYEFKITPKDKGKNMVKVNYVSEVPHARTPQFLKGGVKVGARCNKKDPNGANTIGELVAKKIIHLEMESRQDIVSETNNYKICDEKITSKSKFISEQTKNDDGLLNPVCESGHQVICRPIVHQKSVGNNRIDECRHSVLKDKSFDNVADYSLHSAALVKANGEENTFPLRNLEAKNDFDQPEECEQQYRKLDGPCFVPSCRLISTLDASMKANSKTYSQQQFIHSAIKTELDWTPNEKNTLFSHQDNSDDDIILLA